MTTPSLSVVLPLYNGEEFVDRAINSVLTQTNLPADCEIIVVDDGSTDGGAKRCYELAKRHPEIRLERHRVNRGVAAARNLGVKLAQGEYLAFIDQDDEWTTDKWLRQHEVIQLASVDYVLGHQVFTVKDPAHPPRWFRPEWENGPQKGYVLGAMLIRRSDFLRVGLLGENFISGTDDVDWFIRARAMFQHELMLTEIVLQRYVHDRNASSRTDQSTPELLAVIRKKLHHQRLGEM
jgi:glycosyltransferase involved in cell wall biosynthesis